MKRSLLRFIATLILVIASIAPARELEPGDFEFFTPEEGSEMVTIFYQPPPNNSRVIGNTYGGSPAIVSLDLLYNRTQNN